MKLLLLMAAILAVATARPEKYRETEDFQYARSSSDAGSKSGYYGAQRGNMGGNYERAHNMDSLAQHQMSGLVRQVDGELGDGSKTRTGDVFASANSRGIYGSGKYDLSNLEGRNFGEGGRTDNSHTHSSLSSHNAGYSGHSSHSSGYSSSSSSQAHNAGSQSHSSGLYGHHDSNSYGSDSFHSQNLQSLDSSHSANAYGAVEQSGHSSQSTYHGHGSSASSNDNHYMSSSNPQSRLIWTMPVKIYGRPGSRVAVPVGVESYDAGHSASFVDQNAINSEAEVLSNSRQHEYKPSNSAKHYESSYNYRKQWERHNTNPEVVALSTNTENPFSRNSELHEDAASSNSHHNYQAQRAQSAHSSDYQSAYNTKSDSSQSRYQSGYNSQRAGSDLHNSNAYTQERQGSASSDGDSKPRSYHSSYSYHKAWERQGDPYEIKPDGSTAEEYQRLTSANSAYGSHQYGRRNHQSHQSYSSQDDCDEDGHVRVARSVGQQAQTEWQDLENIQQQSQDLTQGFERPNQRQTWNDHTRNHNIDGYDKIEDFGQETQNLGQQSQNNWDDGYGKLEDLGQQTQDLGQQTQNSWGQGYERQEDLGQQTQDLGQQTQDSWGQGFERQEDLGQQTQDLGQQTQDLGQQTQDSWGQGFDKIEDLRHQSQNIEQRSQNWGQESNDLTQQSVSQWNDLENLGQQSQNNNKRKTIRLNPQLMNSSPVIRAWVPIEHQHNIASQQRIHSNIGPAITIPALEIYISVNPNMNKYTNYNEKNMGGSIRPVKSGPVKFLKDSEDPNGNLAKSIKTSGRQPFVYRESDHIGQNSNLHSPNMNKVKVEQHPPYKYSIKQTQNSYQDWIRKKYKNRQDPNIYQDKIYNFTNLDSNMYDQNNAESRIQYSIYSSNVMDSVPRNNHAGPYDVKKDEQRMWLDKHPMSNQEANQRLPNYLKLSNGYQAHEHNSHDQRIQLIRRSKNETDKQTVNVTSTELKQMEPTQIISTKQDINDQPEINLYFKNGRKKYRANQKLSSLEKVIVEQKNVDDLIEQRDDLSQEIWEQNFVHLGKERNNVSGQEKNSESEEETPTKWDHNYSDRENLLGLQWKTNIDHLNISLQKLRNHKQAVDEYVYANARPVRFTENHSEEQEKNTARIKFAERVGVTRNLSTTKMPPPSVEQSNKTEKPPSPLWSAMESYFSFAKDVLVSWFNN